MNIEEIDRQGERAEDGAWVKDIPGAGDLELKVRGMGNTDFLALRAQLYAAEPIEHKPRGVLTEEASDRHSVELLNKTILLDWRNLTGSDKKPIPFSLETSLRLLSNRRSYFRRYVSFAAERVAQDGVADDKAAEGN